MRNLRLSAIATFTDVNPYTADLKSYAPLIDARTRWTVGRLVALGASLGFLASAALIACGIA